MTNNSQKKQPIPTDYHQLYQLMSAQGQVLVTLDQSLKMVQISSQMSRYTGTTIDSLLGMDFAIITNVADRPSLEAYFDTHLKEIRTREITVNHHNKIAHHMMLTILPFDEINGLWTLSLAPLTEHDHDPHSINEQTLFTMRGVDTVMMWRTNHKGQADYFNDAWLRFTGQSYASQMNEGWIALVHENDRTAIEMMYKQVYQEHNSFSLEYRLRRHDYEYRWVLHEGSPRYDSKGQFAGYIGTCIDITERILAEHALAQSEQRNHAMLDALPDTMFVMNRDSIITEFRAGEGNHLGARTADLQNKHLHDIDLPPKVSAILSKHLEASLTTDRLQSFEYHFQEDNRSYYIEAHMVKLNDEEVLAVTRDITLLKESQHTLQNRVQDLQILRQLDNEISERLEVAYVIQMALDAAFRMSNANAGFIALVIDGELVIGDYLGVYEREALVKALSDIKSLWQIVLFNGQITLITDEKINDLAGLLPDTEAVMAIPLISQDRVIGIMGLETKKSERFNDDNLAFLKLIAGRIASHIDNADLYETAGRQLEEVQRLYDEVTQLEQLKTDMIRIASHDLRNPLAGILGYVEMLKWDQDTIDDSHMSYIKQIEVAARQMQTITTGILSLERIEQMVQNSTSALFNFTEMVKETIVENEPYAQRKNQKLTSTITGKPVLVNGDSLQIHEAVSNLINNAIKYTPDEGRIKVTLKAQDKQAIFSVIDTGYGIPENQQEKLFRPFFRAESQATKDIEGTGLGLHLVKNIIERHDGDISFKSTFGEGSTFTMSLPISLG